MRLKSETVSNGFLFPYQSLTTGLKSGANYKALQFKLKSSPGESTGLQRIIRQTRKWRHAKFKGLGILTDDREGKEAGNVSGTLPEGLVQLVAVGEQRPVVSFKVRICLAQKPEPLEHRIWSLIVTEQHEGHAL